MKKLAILITCLLTMGAFAWGQTCPSGCTTISTGNVQPLLLSRPDCRVDVTYDVLDCGGIVSIRITGYTVTAGCGGMTNFSIYHYNVSTLEEYISLGLLDYYSEIISSPVPCPAGPNYIKVYTAQCGIWVGCTYEVTGAPLSCDNGYSGPPPHTPGTPSTVTVYKWQSCGTICCENVYEICQNASSSVTNITKISSGPQGGSTCSGEATYAPKTCQNGCM